MRSPRGKNSEDNNGGGSFLDGGLDAYTSGEFLDESVAEDCIEEFEDNTLWGQLIGRLSDRDAMRQTGVNHLNEIEMSERIKA